MPDIPPEMNFSDIIVPTMDLVRGSFVLEMLLTNNKKVRLTVSLLKRVERCIESRLASNFIFCRAENKIRAKKKLCVLLLTTATKYSMSRAGKRKHKLLYLLRVIQQKVSFTWTSSNYFVADEVAFPLQVMCVGPTGSGKTLCVANKLLNYMPKEFLSHFLNFSARTSANQTQDIIDSKLDKRWVQL